MDICIDFDGTCVTHRYPKIGRDIGAVPVLKKLTENGHQLILWTMRSGKELQEAVNWFKENDIPLYGVQRNPTQGGWTESPKAYAELYIDDAALGAPTIINNTISNRKFMNWYEVYIILSNMGLFHNKNAHK